MKKRIIIFTAIFLSCTKLFAQLPALVKDSNPAGNSNEQNLTVWKAEIYPNPVATMLRVSFHTSESSCKIFHLTNTNGNVAWQKKLQLQKGYNDLVIDMAPLSDGSYLLDIEGKHFGKVLHLAN